MITIVPIDKDQLTLKEYVYSLGISRKALKDIKSKGDILVNNEHKTVRYLVKYQDRVEVIFPIEEHTMHYYPLKLDIRYEDEDYLIINKPAGIPCIPTKRYPDKTLANAVVYYYKQIGLQATAHFVNRLDKDTQGLLLVSKTRQGHAILSKDIKQVRRVYHCLVEGQLQGQGTITTIIKKEEDSQKRIVAQDGKLAVTNYRVIEHVGEKTLVECTLKTGRTHQIRVHMSHIGHVLCYDALYGSEMVGKYYLDSIELSFEQPFTKKQICIKK